LQVYKNYYGENHVESLRVLRYLGRAYFKEGNMKAAEEIFQKLFKISKLLQTNSHPHIHKIYEDLGTLYHNFSLIEMQLGNKENFQNYHEQALDCMTQALKIVKDNYPEGSPIIMRIGSLAKSIENKELRSINLE
jgi:tetratricopeptide (TPR) repeat protein